MLLGKRLRGARARSARRSGGRCSGPSTRPASRSPTTSCRWSSPSATAAPPTPSFEIRSADGARHAVEASAFPILTAHGSQGGDRHLLAVGLDRTGRGAEMKVKLWGTRGSIPSPGPETIRYGGNTSCVGVTLSDGSLLALDAGTGIRNLGLALPTEPTRLHILLTHLHLDHIQGLVFFAPAFRPQTEIVIWGPASPEASLRDRIARYISAPLSPVEVRELPCDVSFRHCPETEWEIGPARIRAASVAHRGPTLGYRIDDGDRSLAYIPDHEPALGADLETLEEEWISGFALARDASTADPRRPVRRRRVPRPRRLGPLGALPLARLRAPHRRRAHRPLPPRPDALRRAARRARRRGAGALGGGAAATPARSSWASRAASTSCGRPFAARSRQSEAKRRPSIGTNGMLFSSDRLPSSGMPSTPRIDAAADRSALVRGALSVANRAHAGQTRDTGFGDIPFIEHPLAVAELLAEHGPLRRGPHGRPAARRLRVHRAGAGRADRGLRRERRRTGRSADRRPRSSISTRNARRSTASGSPRRAPTRGRSSPPTRPRT